MSEPLRCVARPYGVKTTMLIAAAVVVLPLAGCGNGSDKASAKPVRSTPCDEAIPECMPTAKASFIGVPAAEVGRPFRFQVPTAGGAANLEVTVASMKTRPGTDSDPASTVTVCVRGTLRNVGTVAYKADDTDAQTGAQWFGLDGQQADVEPGTIGDCGGGRVWAGIDQPAPLPGRFVSGVWMYSVPDRPGALEITDSVGHPLYRVDYGKQSAQVRINAIGQ